nr:hypothetical protein [Acinetobacter sp. neg1]
MHQNGEELRSISKKGYVEVAVEIDTGMQKGIVSQPHSYDMRNQEGDYIGPRLNMLTSGVHCEPFTKTPYLKYVPVKQEKVV